MIQTLNRILPVLGIAKYTTFFLLFFIFTLPLSAQKAGPMMAKTEVDTSDSKPSSLTTAPGTLSEDGNTYVSRNGNVYKKGDSIIFNASTGLNQCFQSVPLLRFGTLVSVNTFLPGTAAGEELEILEFRKEKNGTKRTYAVVKFKYSQFAVFIERSLATKEIR